jgi:hypothetical protein
VRRRPLTGTGASGYPLRIARRENRRHLTPMDPSTCTHDRSVRLGIQRFPFPPYRVYLLRCCACETTITTGSLREARKSRAGSGGGPAAGETGRGS